MNLNQLPKLTKKSKKRVGRGYGSGKGGHTSGRGAKGLKARSKVALTFDGTKIKKSFIQRLPLRRGRGKFKSFKPKPIIVNVKYLNLLPKDSLVDVDALIKHKIVTEEAKRVGVKILGEGDLKVALKVGLTCSQGAVKKIEKAGGKVLKRVAKKEKTSQEEKPTVKKKASAKKVAAKKPRQKSKKK